jgi:hypothetical protein
MPDMPTPRVSCSTEQPGNDDTGSRRRVPFVPSLSIHHSAAYQFGYTREREVQAVTCARFVEDHMAVRDAHAVLLGDFNDTPGSSSLRFWTGRQSLEGFCVAYQDAWEAVHPGSAGHTFSPENRSCRPARCRSRSDGASTTSWFGAATTDPASRSQTADPPGPRT